MVYQGRFVTVVRCEGKILREDFNHIVRLPFGEEYSILLKNLNSVKSEVKISVDGQDVLNHHRIIIDSNDEVELEGFLKGTTVSNKFKFIKKTEEIVNHRGDRIDDGIIRVEFRFEKRKDLKEFRYGGRLTGQSFFKNDNYRSIGSSYEGISPRSVYKSSPNDTVGCLNVNSLSNNQREDTFKQLDEGITVRGSQSNQAFQYGSIGTLEENSEVIIIRLRGISEQTGNQITQPITINTKLECETCGNISKSNSKFCSNCGTALF